MEYDKEFHRLFKLDDSMEMAVVFEANDIGCTEEELLNAICCAFLWKNPKPLELLYGKGINKG